MHEGANGRLSRPDCACIKSFSQMPPISSTLHTLNVLASAGINFNHIARLHKERHLHRRTRLYRRSFQHIRRGIATYCLLGVGHFQVDKRGQLDADWRFAIKERLNNHTLFKKLRAIPQQICRKGKLVIGLRVHKDIFLPILIQILARPMFDAHQINLFTGAEPHFLHAPRLQILQPGAHKRTPVSWAYMVKFNDAMQFAIIANNDTITNIRRCSWHTLPGPPERTQYSNKVYFQHNSITYLQRTHAVGQSEQSGGGKMLKSQHWHRLDPSLKRNVWEYVPCLLSFGLISLLIE